MDSLHALLLAEHDKVLQQIDVLEKESKRLRRENYIFLNIKESQFLDVMTPNGKKRPTFPKATSA